MGLLRHLQIVVVESDKAKTQRHRQHDPDIGIGGIGPQQRRHHQPGQDHQPAHRRRALLGDQMRRRTVGADRLALALPQPQMIDDPGAEQEHEQRARHHRPAGAEGDVAEDVEEPAEKTKTGNGVGQLDQPVKHSICPITRLGCTVFSGKAPCERLDNRFRPQTKQILVVLAGCRSQIAMQKQGVASPASLRFCR